MRKNLTYCSFVIASLVVIATFVTAATYAQLAVAIVLYPLLIYFAFKTFPRRVPSKKPAFAVQPPVKLVQKVEEKTADPKNEMWGIADIDKRMFLKLIGGVGLSLFLFSIFNKKAEGLFFKSLPASGPTSGTFSLADTKGNKIDPAQNQPTDGYRISEIDNNVITFYGFTNKDGAWFVMQEDTDRGSFRYARGDANFPGNWTNREHLKYDYYSNIF